MEKILVKNAIERKPDYFYYIDGEGNIWETRAYNSAQTFKEKLICRWIDFKRFFR